MCSLPHTHTLTVPSLSSFRFPRISKTDFAPLRLHHSASLRLVCADTYSIGELVVTMAFLKLSIHVCLLVSLLVRYCNGQEAPSILTPTYAANVTHRQSFCSQHDLVNSRQIERRDALRGVELRVGMPDYYLSEEGIISPDDPNIGAMVLDELAKRAGFTWRNSYGVVRSPSGNETWNGALYWSTDVYDMSMDWWVRSIERLSHGTLFPEGWKDGKST